MMDLYHPRKSSETRFNKESLLPAGARSFHSSELSGDLPRMGGFFFADRVQKVF
ncbi:MAG: hypothetical protein K6U03_06430 [Firmicutes bacterium]|nr:hypothetical protein [Bacillota bacterium]